MSAQDPSLLQALQDSALYDHPVTGFSVIETHISWVLMTGPYAYKIKKEVDLGFLDFSTLERRRYYCEEELRLNRRFAPALYRAVIPVTGTASRPRLGGTGAPIEYAVQMVQFDPAAQFDRLLAAGRLTPELLARFATSLVRLHDAAGSAGAADLYGTPAAVTAPVEENFAQIILPPPFADEAAVLRELHDWCTRANTRLHPAFERRKAAGRVRECHGDLHLGNITLHGNEPLAFDCLEFDDRLRWIDVMSEIAFLIMDLDEHGRDDLGLHFLNEYLHHGGDYEGLALLRYYQVYRALVRAKVESIRLRQTGAAEPAGREGLRAYIRLARDYIRPQPRALVITHGPSGSGKTMHSAALLASCGMIRVRSDVERKRLSGLAPAARTRSGVDAGLYTRAAGERTYRRLEELAAAIVAAGHTALIDATFLTAAQRAPFRALAAQLGVPFVILDFQATEELLRERVAARSRAGSDASEATTAVLERQLQGRETLTADERAAAIAVDTGLPVDGAALAAAIRRRISGAEPPAD